jgi:hypothetical protein
VRGATRLIDRLRSCCCTRLLHPGAAAELLVGGDDQVGVFVAGGDELEEQVCRFGLEGGVAELDLCRHRDCAEVGEDPIVASFVWTA